MNIALALILAVLVGVILGSVFTAQAIEQTIQDRLTARDEMWSKALGIQEVDAP